MKNGVEFREQNRYEHMQSNTAKSDSAMVKALIKTGIVKTANGAYIIMIFIIVLTSALSIWIFWRNSQGDNGTIMYREDIPPEILEQIPSDQLRKIPSRN